MKKILLFIFALGVFASSANAQRKKGREKIKAYKVSFITEKLNLSPEQAEKFWPVYNKYDDDMMQLRREERYNIKKQVFKDGGIEQLSEKESKNILKKIRNIAKQRYEIKANFHDRVSKILPFKKILTLEIAEHEFHRKLFKKYKGEKRRKQSK